MYKNEEIEYNLASKTECFVWEEIEIHKGNLKKRRRHLAELNQFRALDLQKIFKEISEFSVINFISLWTKWLLRGSHLYIYYSVSVFNTVHPKWKLPNGLQVATFLNLARFSEAFVHCERSTEVTHGCTKYSFPFSGLPMSVEKSTWVKPSKTT